jgi:predicted negative regulator of RcsB-dependent stress response
MAENTNKQAGFGIVEAVVVFAIIALVVIAGWFVYQRVNQDNDAANETSAQVEEAPQVENAADLAESEQYLEDLDIDGQLDTSELDEAVSL